METSAMLASSSARSLSTVCVRFDSSGVAEFTKSSSIESDVSYKISSSFLFGMWFFFQTIDKHLRGGDRGQGCTKSQREADLLFVDIVTKNCIKMKEIGPRGGSAGPYPPPLGSTTARLQRRTTL